MGPDDEINLNEQEEQEEEGKGLSQKAVGMIALAAVIIVLIVLFTLKGMSVSKNVTPKNTAETQPSVSLNENSSNTTKEEKSVETEKKVEEPKKETSESVDKTTEKPVTKEEKQEVNTTKEAVENSGSLVKVEEPSLGDKKESSVIVSGKSVYKLGGSKVFLYDLKLIMPSADGNYDIVDYYCNKKTYDAISQGETVSISYQVDSSGVIAIISLSK